MYVSRKQDGEILSFIQRRVQHKNVLLVEGARQVGKTALIDNAIARSGKPLSRTAVNRDGYT